jgi:hypothetical protein
MPGKATVGLYKFRSSTSKNPINLRIDCITDLQTGTNPGTRSGGGGETKGAMWIALAGSLLVRRF